MNHIGINRIVKIFEAAFNQVEHLLNLSDTKITSVVERTELRKSNTLSQEPLGRTSGARSVGVEESKSSVVMGYRGY